MAEHHGVDYAWWSADIHALVRALKVNGKEFVCRYLSHDSGKSLHRDEAQAIGDGGLWNVVVWETTANRAADGYNAGAADAHEAVRQADLCGMPSGRPIYFAVDYDANLSDVRGYFEGVGHVLNPDQIGVYGGIRVVKELLDAGLVKWGWQASAWSYGAWEPRAHIRQYGSQSYDGVDCDNNTAMFDDYGQWRVGVAPVGGSNGNPNQEEDLPYLFGQVNKGKDAVTSISIPGGGKLKNIGFFADTGLEMVGDTSAVKEVLLRVAVGHADSYAISHVKLDSTKAKAIVGIPADADSVSIKRENSDPFADQISVGWDAS